MAAHCTELLKREIFIPTLTPAFMLGHRHVTHCSHLNIKRILGCGCATSDFKVRRCFVPESFGSDIKRVISVTEKDGILLIAKHLQKVSPNLSL